MQTQYRIHRSKLKIIEKSRQISELKESDDQRMDQFLSYSSIFGYEFEYFAAVHNERKNKKRGGRGKGKKRKNTAAPEYLLPPRPFCIFLSSFCSRNVYSPCIDRSCMTYSDTFPFSQTGRRRLFLLRTKCLFTADASVTFLRGQSVAVVVVPLLPNHQPSSATISFHNYFLSKL